MPLTPETSQPPSNGSGSVIIGAIISGILSLFAILLRIFPKLWRSKEKKSEDEAKGRLGLETLYSSSLQRIIEDYQSREVAAREERKELRREIEELRDHNDHLHDIILKKNELIAELKIRLGEDPEDEGGKEHEK